MSTFSFTQGEIPAPLTVQFTDGEGGANLATTDYDARMKLGYPDGTVVERTATVNNTGLATYVWQEADLDEQHGLHVAEVWIGNGTTRLASKAFKFLVRPSQGVAPDI